MITVTASKEQIMKIRVGPKRAIQSGVITRKP
jgi:hypothetical protein